MDFTHEGGGGDFVILLEAISVNPKSVIVIAKIYVDQHVNKVYKQNKSYENEECVTWRTRQTTKNAREVVQPLEYNIYSNKIEWSMPVVSHISVVHTYR